MLGVGKGTGALITGVATGVLGSAGMYVCVCVYVCMYLCMSVC
jgi:hypothetical protein